MTTTEILATLARFTGNVFRYPGLAKPYATNGYLVASDSRVLAFCPCDAAGVDPADHQPLDRVPDNRTTRYLIDGADVHGPPIPIPDVDPQWLNCPDCEGLGGFEMARNGEKSVRWIESEPRVFMCEACDGAGRFENIERIQIGETEAGKPLFYNDHYLARLREAGVTHLRVPRKSNEVPARGQVGPITVLLMGLADETRDKAKGGAE
jgi:hypothetical protein